MAFDNARTLNCYKLRTFILLSMNGCLRKQVVHFNSFYGLRLVDFMMAIHLVLISDSKGGIAFVAVIKKDF